MSFITFYTRVQTFANIYKYSAMKGANRKREELRELAAHSRGMLKKWTGGVILIIWVLSDDPGLWDVLGNNTILYGVLHRLDSDEHQIRLLCSLGSLDTASDVISCLMSGQWTWLVLQMLQSPNQSMEHPRDMTDHDSGCVSVSLWPMMDPEEC